ncbi:MAG: Uma2 family endonuclease [Dehalococcoidia bacterium]
MVMQAPARPATPDLYGDPSRPFTAEDWWAMPETAERYELLHGVLVLMPSPSRKHQDATLDLAVALRRFADSDGGWAGVSPLGVTLSDDVVFEPDAMYVSEARSHILSERGVDGAPDLVVEVAPPSTRRYDRRDKLPAYFEAGVREVWIVDPEARTLTVVTVAGETTVPFGDEIPSTVVAIGAGGLR